MCACIPAMLYLYVCVDRQNRQNYPFLILHNLLGIVCYLKQHKGYMFSLMLPNAYMNSTNSIISYTIKPSWQETFAVLHQMVVSLKHSWLTDDRPDNFLLLLLQ